MTTPAQHGFVDLQVNGYAGVDFNSDALTPDSLHSACRSLRDDGVAGVLATIITAPAEQMATRLKRLAEFREQDPLARELIWGIHVEGPFLSPEAGYVGAHPPQHIRPADLAVMQQLLDAAVGQIRMVTLAPEHDAQFQVTRLLAGEGVLVSAGHCNPSLDVLRDAIDAGLSMFTHLGNGCPVQLDRHENIIQRVLHLSDRLRITFIADGAHLPFYVLSNLIKAVGAERAIVITDATAAASMGAGRFALGGIDAVVGADGVPRLASDPRYLAGSALTMPRAASYLAQELKFSAEQIDRLCRTNAIAELQRAGR
jgi:N-acetylglucosamine-6-phosphate deacetylase